jgi:hypothetical protein
VYTITPKAARFLMEIEAARADIEQMPLPPTVEAELRRQARFAARGMGRGWLACRGRSFETKTLLQINGNLSAIHWKVIGNKAKRIQEWQSRKNGRRGTINEREAK